MHWSIVYVQAHPQPQAQSGCPEIFISPLALYMSPQSPLLIMFEGKVTSQCTNLSGQMIC